MQRLLAATKWKPAKADDEPHSGGAWLIVRADDTEAERLYQKAWFEETANGDLEAAVAIYREIIAKHRASADTAAKAKAATPKRWGRNSCGVSGRSSPATFPKRTW